MVNDVTLTPDGSAYLTDSTRGVIYRVTPGQLAHARTHGGRHRRGRTRRPEDLTYGCGISPVCSAANANWSAYSAANALAGLPMPCPALVSTRSSTGPG